MNSNETKRSGPTGRGSDAQCPGTTTATLGEDSQRCASVQPQKGDIWEDLTPGYHRFVRVVRVGDEGALIERVEYVNGNWRLPRRAPTRETKLTRFNGQSGGFRLHHRESI